MASPFSLLFDKKIPPLRQISSLYGTIVFLVYGWTSMVSAWKVSSWLYFLDFGQIMATLAYILCSSLLESLILLLLFVGAGLVLPAGWLRNHFVVRGSIIFYCLTFWVVWFDLSSPVQSPDWWNLLSFLLGFLFTAGLGIWLAERLPALHKFLDDLSDRLTVFLYLWLPLSLAGLLLILFRNI